MTFGRSDRRATSGSVPQRESGRELDRRRRCQRAPGLFGGPSSVRVWESRARSDSGPATASTSTTSPSAPTGRTSSPRAGTERRGSSSQGRVLRVLRAPGFSLFAARFSADGRRVATADGADNSGAPRVTIWDWRREAVVRDRRRPRAGHGSQRPADGGRRYRTRRDTGSLERGASR